MSASIPEGAGATVTEVTVVSDPIRGKVRPGHGVIYTPAPGRAYAALVRGVYQDSDGVRLVLSYCDSSGELFHVTDVGPDRWVPILS